MCQLFPEMVFRIEAVHARVGFSLTTSGSLRGSATTFNVRPLLRCMCVHVCMG